MNPLVDGTCVRIYRSLIAYYRSIMKCSRFTMFIQLLSSCSSLKAESDLISSHPDRTNDTPTSAPTNITLLGSLGHRVRPAPSSSLQNEGKRCSNCSAAGPSVESVRAKKQKHEAHSAAQDRRVFLQRWVVAVAPSALQRSNR